MPENRIAGVRLPEELYKTIEDLYFEFSFLSRAECIRWLLEEGFKDLIASPEQSLSPARVLWQTASGSTPTGDTPKDITVQLPDGLFETLEQFRRSRRIHSCAEAIRIALKQAVEKYKRGELTPTR